MNSTHSWKFFRAGGFDQVRLSSGADLVSLEHLDQKLWVALACPTAGLEFDAHTLGLIDTDKDGRIRVPEVVAAVNWACGLLKRPDDLLKGGAELPLDAINDTTPAGNQIATSARRILGNLGKKDATAISPADTTDKAKIFGQTVLNGDGIIPPEAASDESTRSVVNDIIACLGPDLDRSGKPGTNQAKIDQFFADAQAFSDWHKKAETDPAILAFGPATADAVAAYREVKPKVDDYFARCRLAAYDPRAIPALNREEKEYVAMGGRDFSASASEVAGFPLAQISPGKPLSLKDGLNPAWVPAIDRFKKLIVGTFLNGTDSLTEADWVSISERLAPYEAWLTAKAGTSVEKLGLKRVREILAGKSKENLTALVAKDKALEIEAGAIADVDRLVHYYRDLYKLLVNFVSFQDFYSRKDKAIFQAGTLYLDQRACELCLSVDDAGKHAAMAGLAGAYLAYCDCVRKSTGQKRQIVAAFTDGDSDNLMVGRNGVFYDRKGNDWDATITKIVDNPISIRQAFWAPYKKLVRMIEEQVAKRAAAADAAASDKLAVTAANVAKADQVAIQASKTPPQPKKVDVGVVAALGVAVGAIGGALASLATGLMKLPVWQIPLVFVGLILLISLPSMTIAWLKLRKRNLGPILDANGWAVNARALINMPFGGSLTKLAKLPPGSDRDVVDPFAERKSPWPKLIVLAVLIWIAYAVLNHMGYVYDWTRGRLGDPRPAVATQDKPTPAAPEKAGAEATPEAPK
jgi:hypothetical protein